MLQRLWRVMRPARNKMCLFRHSCTSALATATSCFKEGQGARVIPYQLEVNTTSMSVGYCARCVYSGEIPATDSTVPCCSVCVLANMQSSPCYVDMCPQHPSLALYGPLWDTTLLAPNIILYSPAVPYCVPVLRVLFLYGTCLEGWLLLPSTPCLGCNLDR